MSRSFFIFMFANLLTLILGACAPSHDVLGLASTSIDTSYVLNPSPDSGLAATANTIFNTKCSSCHFQGSPYGYIDMNNLINDGYVTQGPLNVSVFYKCINGPTQGTTCKTRSGKTVADMAVEGGLTNSEINDFNLYIDDLFIDP